ELEIHEGQGILHGVDLSGGEAYELGALTDVGAQADDLIGRTEGRREQAVGVQLLLPLTVDDIGFASGNMLETARIRQANVEAACFEDLEKRDPVVAGGLHGDGLDAAVSEPVGEAVEVGGEGQEAADRLGVAVGWDSNHVEGRPDVDGSGAE